MLNALTEILCPVGKNKDEDENPPLTDTTNLFIVPKWEL